MRKKAIRSDFATPGQTQNPNQGRQGQWPAWRQGNRGQNRGQQFKGKLPPRDPNAMDTSATVRKATTDAEKTQHRQEGRCYDCSKQGHIARNCPLKKNKICTAQTDGTEEVPKQAALKENGKVHFTGGANVKDLASLVNRVAMVRS
jgi:hypothetical protein